MSKRLARVLAGGAALAVLPVMFAARPAFAVNGCYGDCQPGVVRSQGSLRYDAPEGVNDTITISAGPGFLTVSDPAAALTAGPGCTLVSTHEAHCSSTNVTSIIVRGLDGNDVITNSTSISSRLAGNDGNDKLVGGSGDDFLVGGLGADVLQGGLGSDTVSYGEQSNRLAVRADLDGATGDDGSADDGPAGARDTIAADVENLEGTISDDTLIGNAGANVIDGNGGRDKIQGLGGNDQLTARGGGTIDGGANTDHCTSDLRLSGTPDTFVACETTEILT
jgi:Ca2+-binding RTX toxin-like protein